MKPTTEQINQIVEELDCGLRCFYHLKTGKIMVIPDMDEMMGEDEEIWEEDIQEIEGNREDYFEFVGQDSFDDYKVMKQFAETVEDEAVRESLTAALNRPKPFRNFKDEVDGSGDYREKWFDFEHQKFIEWVKKQIEMNEEEFHE